MNISAHDAYKKAENEITDLEEIYKWAVRIFTGIPIALGAIALFVLSISYPVYFEETEEMDFGVSFFGIEIPIYGTYDDMCTQLGFYAVVVIILSLIVALGIHCFFSNYYKMQMIMAKNNNRQLYLQELEAEIRYSTAENDSWIVAGQGDKSIVGTHATDADEVAEKKMYVDYCFCPRCRKQNKGNNMFCTECGTSLR